MFVLGFGTYDRSVHPRVGVILAGLAAHGDRVVEVNEPLGFSTAERVQMLRSGASSWRLLARLLGRWRRLRRQVRTGSDHPDVVLVGYLGHFDVLLARWLFRGVPIVLDQLIFAADTARDRGVGRGPKLLLLDLLDRVAVACADLIVVDTREQLQLLPRRRRADGVVVPVGADRDWFAARRAAGDDRTAAGPQVPPSSPPLRVIFYGLFTPLHGTLVIAEALARLADEPSVEITMVGTGQDHARARALAAGNPHITWIDWVEPAELPALVAGHDVCLGIFGSTPKAQRVVPNKMFQGAAAGCALITADTAAARRILGDGALYIAAADPAALAAALRLLAADPEFLRLCRQRAAEQAVGFTAAAVLGDLRERIAARAGASTSPRRRGFSRRGTGRSGRPVTRSHR